MTPAIAGEGKNLDIIQDAVLSYYHGSFSFITRQRFLHDDLHRLHLPRARLHLHHHRDREETVRWELEEDAGAEGPDTGAAKTCRNAEEIGWTRGWACDDYKMPDILCNFASCLILESHNLEIDLDLAADLAQLKKNLAKMRKGKMGKGLHDVLIEEFDWVNTSITASLKNTCSKYFIQQMQNNRRVKAVTIFLYETSLWGARFRVLRRIHYTALLREI